MSGNSVPPHRAAVHVVHLIAATLPFPPTSSSSSSTFPIRSLWILNATHLFGTLITNMAVAIAGIPCVYTIRTLEPLVAAAVAVAFRRDRQAAAADFPAPDSASGVRRASLHGLSSQDWKSSLVSIFQYRHLLVSSIFVAVGVSSLPASICTSSALVPITLGIMANIAFAFRNLLIQQQEESDSCATGMDNKRGSPCDTESESAKHDSFHSDSISRGPLASGTRRNYGENHQKQEVGEETDEAEAGEQTDSLLGRTPSLDAETARLTRAVSMNLCAFLLAVLLLLCHMIACWLHGRTSFLPFPSSPSAAIVGLAVPMCTCLFFCRLLSAFLSAHLRVLQFSVLTVLKRPILIFTAAVYFRQTLETGVMWGNIAATLMMALWQSDTNVDRAKEQQRQIASETRETSDEANLQDASISRPRKYHWMGLWVAWCLVAQSFAPQARDIFLLPSASSRAVAVVPLASQMEWFPSKSHCRHATPPPLWYWHYDGNLQDTTPSVNFGDQLAEVIFLQLVPNGTVVPPPNKADESLYLRSPVLRLIGSIVFWWRAHPCDVVWGAGARGTDRLPSDGVMDVRAVRGPWTRRVMMNSWPGVEIPEVYGDPALLLPYLFPDLCNRPTPKDRNGTLVILHFGDIGKLPNPPLPAGSPHSISRVMTALDPWQDLVRAMCASELVASSSLHGIIAAEAYGVPARYLRLTEREGLFKFADYYAGSGRKSFQPAGTVEEAIWLGGEPPIQWDPVFLLRAFPRDLYPNFKIPTIHARYNSSASRKLAENERNPSQTFT
jgi:pyruvyltransferase